MTKQRISQKFIFFSSLACFVLYLKIINTFLENNNLSIFKQIVQGTQNGIEILVDQV